MCTGEIPPQIYWWGNAKIMDGKVKPEMNNLRFDILQKTLFVYPAKLAGYQKPEIEKHNYIIGFINIYEEY